MEKLTLEEIEPVEAYAAHREAAQHEAIRTRALRRVALGDRISLSFENRATLRYQIQEMCRAEGIREADKVRAEVETYNQLVPDAGELSATLMIEIPDLGRIKPELDRFLGLDRPGVLILRVGPHLVPAEWEPGHSREDRIAAVHYVRFRLPPPAVQAFRAGALVALVSAHPGYQAVAEIAGETRAELARDLG